MNAKIWMHQYVIFNKPWKFNTADIKCFTELGKISVPLLK